MRNMDAFSSHFSKAFYVIILLFMTTSYSITTQTESLCSIPFEDTFIEDIPEDFPLNSILKHLNIFGKDSEIELFLNGADDYFTLNSTTRNLILVSKLDAEKDSSLVVKLSCMIKATIQTVLIDLRIIIADINDNAPQFEKSEYTANVDELIAVGSIVFEGISAIDSDSGNWYITYEIESGNFSDYFIIPTPAQATIYLSKPLDFEKFREASITVKANDNHPTVFGKVQPVLYSTTRININIADADDKNPIFVGSPYTADISDTTLLGMSLAVNPKVIALDQDYGINASVYYTIEEDEYSNYFDINHKTAELQLAKTGLIGDKQITLLLKAMQRDNADKYTYSLLRINVKSAIIQPPKFEKDLYLLSILENISPNSELMIAKVNNDAQTAQVIYKIEETADFRIDSKTGVLSTIKNIDFESKRRYNITITASNSKYESQAVIIINVLNANDNQPIFEKNVYKFHAEKKAEHFIGQVKAVDADEEDQLIFYLADEDPHFTVSNSGKIYVSDSEDELIANSYSLLVHVKDNGSPALSNMALVNVYFNSTNVSTSKQGEEANTVLVTVLGCFTGILLVVVLILVVYLLRRRAYSYDDIDRALKKGEKLNASFNNAELHFKNEDKTAKQQFGNVYPVRDLCLDRFLNAKDHSSNDTDDEQPNPSNSQRRQSSQFSMNLISLIKDTNRTHSVDLDNKSQQHSDDQTADDYTLNKLYNPNKFCDEFSLRKKRSLSVDDFEHSSNLNKDINQNRRHSTISFIGKPQTHHYDYAFANDCIKEDECSLDSKPDLTIYY